MFQKILSYFIPKIIHKTTSEVNDTLEVCFVNGKLVLDSKNTNYSYGNLQKVLRKGLLKIGKEQINQFQNTLILGVGAGCVIETLIDEFNYNQKIIGIELDEKVIKIANDYFNLKRFKNFDLIQYNAFDYVLETKQKFDFIVIDIFQDTKMPNFLFEIFFIKKIHEILNKKGIVLFNTMVINTNDEKRNIKFIQDNNDFFDISSIKKVEFYNELIFLEKK
jgi:spermidine synthase